MSPAPPSPSWSNPLIGTSSFPLSHSGNRFLLGVALGLDGLPLCSRKAWTYHLLFILRYPWLHRTAQSQRVGKPEPLPIYTEFPKHEHSLLIRRDLVKMAKALRAEINDVVVKYTERKLRKDGTLDVAVMAHEMTQSLVDMIMDQDEHDHAPLLALMILSLGGEFLQRTGIGERRDN